MVSTRSAPTEPLVDLDSVSKETEKESSATADKPSQVIHEETSEAGKKDQKSGDEVRERPVRKQLQKTSIARGIQEGETAETNKYIEDPESSESSQLEETRRTPTPEREARKRSFDEVREGSTAPSEQTSRKFPRQARAVDDLIEHNESKTVAPPPSVADSDRSYLSRPSTPPPTSNSDADRLAESQLSPQNKRNRDTFLASQEAATASETADTKPSKAPEVEQATKDDTPAEEGPTRKRTRDSPPLRSSTGSGQDSKVADVQSGNPEEDKKPGTNQDSQRHGASEKSEVPPPASASKFAASGFAGFTGTASPFGSVSANGNAPSSFSTFGSSKPADIASKPLLSGGFGSTSGGFASLSGAKSGFGSLGGGSAFGRPLAAASPFSSTRAAPLTSFASGKGDFAGATSKSVKPIGSTGADAEDVEGSGEDDGGDPETETMLAASSDKPDERFFEQEVETGEENETTLFAYRAKVYAVEDGQWKERGRGLFKVNVVHEDGSTFVHSTVGGQASVSARFLMRADGSHRLALNSPIKPEVEVRDPSGTEPKTNTAVFMGWMDGKARLLQLKLRNLEQIQELDGVVRLLQQRM